MDKYSLLRRFHHDLRLQFYMYDFMYVDTETIPVEDYFPDTQTSVDKYRKMSTPVPVSKHCLRFIYIRSEYYELDINLYETELKNESDHTSNDIVKLFCENVVVIEEEWFSVMNLTDGATFSAGPD